MKNLFFRNCKHLTALAAVVFFSVFIVCMGAPVASAILIVGLWQLSQFAMSKRSFRCYIGALTPEQVKEFGDICKDLKELGEDIPALRAMLKEFPDVKNNLQKLRKGFASGGTDNTGVRWIGGVPFVADECASALTAHFVLGCSRLENGLEHLIKDASRREHLLTMSRGLLGIEQRTAMTGTEIPLPTQFIGQIVELVFAYGQARQRATVFPLGAGTVKLPRLKAGEDDFGYLGVGTAGMSQTTPEKRVTAELVTFTANKAGGLIRIPFELEEDTFIAIGNFLARYIARQLAKLEDRTLFLADGTATYANQTGVGNYCVANVAYLIQLAAGKTKLTDITVEDVRRLRGRVSAAVLANMAASGQTQAAYYMHPSMEPVLSSFNKYPNFVVFKTENGKSTFDGWPINWIGVSAADDGAAHAGEFAMFFGDLSYWYMGERGQPRIEVSKEVFFATDELALRALERIDVEAMAIDAMATLQLGAASA